jgi:hypothetical protein
MNSYINGIILEAKEEATDEKRIKKIELVLYCSKTRSLVIVLLEGKLAETYAGKFSALIIQRAEISIKGVFGLIDGNLIVFADEMNVFYKKPLAKVISPAKKTDTGGNNAPAAAKPAVPPPAEKKKP